MKTQKNKNPVLDLRNYISFLHSILGSRIYLVLFLTVLAALLESFGIMTLLPLLEQIKGDGAPIEDGNSSPLADLAISLGFGNSTLTLLVLIALAFIGKGAITFIAFAYIAYLKAGLLRELRGRLFDDYCQMSRGYYDSRDTGHFINVINEQCTRALTTFQALSRLGAQIVNTIVYFSLAIYVAWLFGLMSLTVGAILLFLFRRINRYVRQLSRRTAHESGTLANRLIQTLQSFKYLVATGQIKSMRAPITTSIENLSGYEMRRGIAAGFTETVREPLTVAFIMGIIAFQLSYLDEPLEPILVSIVLFYRAMTSALMMQGKLQVALDFAGSLELVRDEYEAQATNRETGGNTAIGPVKEGLHLEGVSFGYQEGEKDVVRDITLMIPAFKTVALVGESGAGKSSLVDILTLSLKPREGRVLIDGMPGEDIDLLSWRNQIGYVQQETVLFDDTIANNICMWAGDPKSDPALMDRIKAAAEQANIAAHIQSMPQGYFSMVGERGLRLSGGQRQRLFIARELFRKPNLLILDEATSALDSESEKHIYGSISKLMGSLTIVIITHRLSTIRNVDTIFVLEKGRLVEEGTFDELQSRPNSKFRDLIALQAV